MSFGLPLSAGMEALCPFRSPCPGLFPYIKDEDGGSRLSDDRGSPIDSLLPQAPAAVTAWGLRAQAGEKRNRQAAAGRLAAVRRRKQGPKRSKEACRQAESGSGVNFFPRPERPVCQARQGRKAVFWRHD